MAQYRPAGFSDSDSDSDDYGFFEKPARRYYANEQYDSKKKVEVRLQDAIINGNLSEVQDIVKYDLNNGVNLKLDSGWTPLMHACFHAQDKIVQFLLENGADPNLHADSMTPVMATCSNSSASEDIIYNIISNLIDKECILNIGDRYGQTPLMRAISSGRLSVVKKLLEQKVNIEMRDQQGWTAIFWAAHHNQPEVMELLISNGARLTEVDKSNRTPLDIANSHEYQNIVDILKKHLNINIENEDENVALQFNTQLRSWHDYYPGLNRNERLKYECEIPHLLYGMKCEKLLPKISNASMDLRSFLLLEENEMKILGVEMPYERQRLKTGLRNFHLRGWKLNSVAGLYARKNENYSVLDCLTTLGTHLQQVYVLEATLQYTLRSYNKIQNQIKYEPPDSPLLIRLKAAAQRLLTNINNIRYEIKNMRRMLSQISYNNPVPADLIKEPVGVTHIILSYMPAVAVVCTLGYFCYHNRGVINNYFLKQ